MRRASGQGDISDHTLRHAALTDLERALSEARSPEPHLLLDRAALRRRLSGLSETEAMDAANAICPAIRRRDALAALAVHAGHRSAGTTVTSYAHGWDLRVFEAVARPMAQSDYAQLAAPLADRITTIETILHSAGSQTSGELSQTSSGDPWEMIEALRMIENGYTPDEVAIAVRLSEVELAAAMETAQGLAGLKTRKGTSRLFPKAGSLAPGLPRSAAEARDAKVLLRELWGLRETQLGNLVWWCATHLMRATRTNSGLRLVTPLEVNRWRAFTASLSPRRWVLHLEGPLDAPDRVFWEKASLMETAWRRKSGARSVTAVARLPRPDSEGPNTKLTQVSNNYASGAPLFAAHALAIALSLTPRDLAISIRYSGPS